MPRRLLASACLALLIAVPASGAVRDTTPTSPLPAPAGLRAFLLHFDEPMQTVYPRTPSFSWSPISGALKYVFQLATNADFDDGTMVWSSDAISTPYTAVPVSLPWMNGASPGFALYARVRAVTQDGPTPWSASFGFDMQGAAPSCMGGITACAASDVPQFPGLIRWTPVEGATSYDLWFVASGPGGSVTKSVSTISNVADEREWYTFNRSIGWDHIVSWRVRAERRLFGQPLSNGVPPVSYGPWSQVYQTTIRPVSNGTLGPIATISDKVTPDGTTTPHTIVPGYAYQTVANSGTSQIQPLYRVVVATDSQCVNVVYRSSIVGGPAWAPRLGGPLGLTAASPLNVTINQATTQPDPTDSVKNTPIHFTAVFSDTTTDFTSSDVKVTGTTGASKVKITGSGTVYDVAVSGMSVGGTVIVTIPRGGAHDENGNANNDSASTDNQVTYNTDPQTKPGSGGPTGPSGPATSPILGDGSQTGTQAADDTVVSDVEEAPSSSSSSSSSSGSSTTGPSGPTGPTSSTSAPDDFSTTGAQIDLWDNSSLNPATQTGRYYWTVVPVGIVTDYSGQNAHFSEFEAPQDACEAGHVASFGKTSQPLVTENGNPYIVGLATNGTLLSSAPDAVYHGSPLVLWRPISGATGYEVQVSQTQDPWKTVTSILTPSTATTIGGLTPGTWFYRVRGIDPFLPGPLQRTAWSPTIQFQIAQSTFQVASGGTGKPTTTPGTKQTPKTPKIVLPAGYLLAKGFSKKIMLGLPKSWKLLPKTHATVRKVAGGRANVELFGYDTKSPRAFTSTCIVVKGAGRGAAPYAKWVAAQVASFKRQLKGAAFNKAIVWLPGGRALRVTTVRTTATAGKQRIWQVAYLFDEVTSAYSLTCSSLASSRPRYQPVFTNAAKTFRVSG